MTLQEAMKMDAITFSNACQAARKTTGAQKQINEGTNTINELIDNFGSFKSSDNSILAIHKAAQAYP